MPDETELTEMYDIKVTRQDGVRTPASGIPFLIMKSVAAEAAPTETEPAPVTDPTPTQTPAATEPQAGDLPLSKEALEEFVAKMIETRVAEVTKAAEGRAEALAAELAVLKDTPIPGGPALTATASVQADNARADALAKAVAFERRAERTTDHELSRYFRDQAAKARVAAQ